MIYDMSLTVHIVMPPFFEQEKVIIFFLPLQYLKKQLIVFVLVWHTKQREVSALVSNSLVSTKGIWRVFNFLTNIFFVFFLHSILFTKILDGILDACRLRCVTFCWWWWWHSSSTSFHFFSFFRDKDVVHKLSPHSSWGKATIQDPEFPEYLPFSGYPTSAATQVQK